MRAMAAKWKVKMNWPPTSTQTLKRSFIAWIDIAGYVHPKNDDHNLNGTLYAVRSDGRMLQFRSSCSGQLELRADISIESLELGIDRFENLFALKFSVDNGNGSGAERRQRQTKII